MPKIVNLVGRKFGILEVVEKSEKKDTGGKTMYVVRCKCGKEKTVRGTNLTSNKIKSCGCIDSVNGMKTVENLTKNKNWFIVNFDFSDVIESITYNIESAVLYVNFKSGKVYKYFNISNEVVNGFLKAKSKGKYFNLHIRNKF